MKIGTGHDGKSISGIANLTQRFTDVLATPKGSLVGAREFGSTFYQLIDRNIDDSFYMQSYIALSDAINNPANGLDDFRLENMQVSLIGERQFEVFVSGQLLSNGEPITLDNIVIQL